MMTEKDILRIVKNEKVEFIQFWFTDILGMLKSFVITPTELEAGLYEGMGFDGSSIEGFARIEESDMVAKPDVSTFQFLPWKQNNKVARMFCDIYCSNGKPYEGDPRRVLKNILRNAANKGYTYYVGPELEFFYFKNNKSPEVLDNGGYFDVCPLDGDDLRLKTITALQSMGIQIEYCHHEVAPSQHEIDMRYDEGLRMADKTMTLRVVVKEIARQNGVYATFMPKPLFGENGSGMHVHQSLFEGEKNSFHSQHSHLSPIGESFVAGIMKYAKEITAITNQWINSYKRLVPGYEAPVYITWAKKNRSALVRVPMYKPGKEAATRIEYRSPDPACNPYLAFAAMLAAGLKGIDGGLVASEPLDVDIFKMDKSEREKNDMLPGSLFEAIEELEKSELARDTLGEHVFNKFVENKKIEWERYCTHVSRYEIKQYLHIL